MRSCALAAIAYFMAVAAPFFGSFSAAFLLSMIVLFSLCLTGFIAGWFPLLDGFLKPERRTAFFGKMRFCHQMTATAFLFIIGCIIGRNPPLWGLQLVILAGAIVFTGRIFFISRIPSFPAEEGKARLEFKEGLIMAIGNKPLTCFSMYLFVLNLAAYGTVPLATIFLKRHLNAPDNAIVMISASALAGMILGYLSGGAVIGKLKVKGALLLFHVIFALVNLALFLIGHGSVAVYVMIGLLLLIYSFAVAGASLVSSAEMMAMSTPGNKTMDMALCGAFYYGGFGLSRLLTSLLLGSGMLAAEWHLGSMSICHYQTLFLLYTAAVIFAAAFLLIVPAIFPKVECAHDAQ